MGLEIPDQDELLEEEGVQTKPRTEVPKGSQEMFYWVEITSVDADSQHIGTMQTIPQGKRVIVLGFDVSSRDGVDSEFALLNDYTMMFNTILETNGNKERSWGSFPKVSMTIGSGNDFNRVIFNYDSSSHVYNINVMGILIPNE